MYVHLLYHFEWAVFVQLVGGNERIDYPRDLWVYIDRLLLMPRTTVNEGYENIGQILPTCFLARLLGLFSISILRRPTPIAPEDTMITLWPSLCSFTAVLTMRLRMSRRGSWVSSSTIELVPISHVKGWSTVTHFWQQRTYQALWQLSEIYVPSSWDWKRIISSSKFKNFHGNIWSLWKVLIYAIVWLSQRNRAEQSFRAPPKSQSQHQCPTTPCMNTLNQLRPSYPHILLGEPFQPHNDFRLLRHAPHSSLKRTPQPRKRSLKDRLRPLRFLMAQQMELHNRAHEFRRRELLPRRFI